MNTDSNTPQPTRIRLYSVLDLIGTLAIGVALGIILCGRVLHHSSFDTVGTTFLITFLVFGGAALSRFALHRQNPPAA